VREVRTFVRAASDVFELTPQLPLTAGRASDCEIVLDDDLASREHCRFELVGDSVFVVDLGSRNGVLVNGLKVNARQELHHADQVTAGRSQLMVLRQAHEPRVAGDSRRPPQRTSSSFDMTGQGSVFEILSGAAKVAITNGDLPGAESSAANLFLTLRANLGRGSVPPERYRVDAIDLALDLAERSGDPIWLERVLELNVAASSLLASDLAERLASLAARIGVPRSLGEYLALARQKGGEAEPSAQVLSRLE
jgi:hypothetical protein